MSDDRPKDADDDDHQIDPALKDKAPETSKVSPQPVNPAGAQRRENESAADRDTDGQRKRAEEGL